jgi:alanine dehydrogenase
VFPSAKNWAAFFRREKRMKISVAKETAPLEERVILRPHEVREIVRHGHTVMVEKNAGAGVHFYDVDYEDAGALVVEDRLALYRDTDMLVKLKVPTTEEFGLLHGNLLFSMLHHDHNPAHIYHLGRNGVTGIEIESIKNEVGERLVDATDMTGEAGVLYATRHLKKTPSEIHALVFGYGRVGSSAIRMCNMLGMQIKILRKAEYPYVEHFIQDKDLVINAIAWPEDKRHGQEFLIRREMLKRMHPGGVVLDLAVDFPSPIETSMPTTLSNPWYVEEGVIHIAIYGYPGPVPISCTQRYSKQILPSVLLLAENNGISGLTSRGALGRALSRAVVDPTQHDWTRHLPKAIQAGSHIE